jgi:hypoxanthine-guanine phosphoribosyltransferase
MANPQKNREIYAALCNELDSVASGNSSQELEALVNKSFQSFLNGHRAETRPVSDYTGEIIKHMQHYCALLSNRQKVDIAGGEREIATEEGALSALKDAHYLAEHLLVPHFRSKNDFSNRVFNDLYNLGLSYAEAVTNGVASEYIGPEDAFNAKVGAVHVAKEGVRIGRLYRDMKDRFGEDMAQKLVKFGDYLSCTKPSFMRSFEVVSTTPKRIMRKDENIEQLVRQITERDERGEFRFKPAAIFPIAHGGTEFGVILANAYQDRGYMPVTYPLLFSMKTRKQRKPWTSNDMQFLGKSLEGKDVIIVEDWVTTGNTVRGILSKLEESFPREIRIATIKRDPEKSKVPFLDKFTFYIGEWAAYPGTKTDSLADMHKP